MLSYVLIIDKRKELSVKYKKSIDDEQTSAVIARTLKDAVALVQESEPDLIIISDSIDEDLSNFCEKMRTLTYNTRPTIIALSKSADTADRIKVLASGADDFLSEPVNIEEFKMRIKAHLRRDIELYETYQFHTVVIDEAQNIKNPKTRNAICVKRLKAKQRFALTGTPIENSLA